MWKKLDDAVGAQPEFASEQTPDFKSLCAVLPSSSANMTSYTAAVNEFTKNATAFIEQLPLLTKARDAYEQAMRASAGLREVLDAGEQNLRTLMTQLEQAINVHRVKPAPDKKNPQPAKVEAMRGTDESSSRIMTRFP